MSVLHLLSVFLTFSSLCLNNQNKTPQILALENFLSSQLTALIMTCPYELYGVLKDQVALVVRCPVDGVWVSAMVTTWGYKS